MSVVWHGAEQLRAFLIPVDDLEPWPGNPRRGDVEAVSASLRRFGQLRPVLVAGDGKRIVAGHHVRLAAIAEGWTHVAVIANEFESEDEARAALLADNRTNELGETDFGLLLAQLDALGGDYAGTGYDDSSLGELRVQLDRLALASALEPAPPETPEERPVDDGPAPAAAEPESVRGEVYELGPHRLMCGDSTDPEHVAALMAGEHASLLFTSPPYSDLRQYGGGDFDPAHLASFIAAWAPHCEMIAVNLGLIMRDGEFIRYWDVYLDAARAAGLKLLAWNVWNREDATSMAAVTMMTFPLWHEWVFVFGRAQQRGNRLLPTKQPGVVSRKSQREADGSIKAQESYVIADHKPLGSVLTTPAQKTPSAGDHPAVFPVPLPLAYIQAVTGHDAVVADPFAGSGTTLIAAELAGRRCRAMEIDPVYCDTIRRRYSELPA